VKSLWNNQI